MVKIKLFISSPILKPIISSAKLFIPVNSVSSLSHLHSSPSHPFSAPKIISLKRVECLFLPHLPSSLHGPVTINFCLDYCTSLPMILIISTPSLSSRRNCFLVSCRKGHGSLPLGLCTCCSTCLEYTLTPIRASGVSLVHLSPLKPFLRMKAILSHLHDLLLLQKLLLCTPLP